MGLFKKRTGDPDEMAKLRSEIAAMGARLEAAQATEAELDSKVAELSVRLDEPSVSDDSDDSPQPVTQAEHDELNARVQELANQLSSAIEAGEEAAAEATDEIELIGTLAERVDEIAQRLDAPLSTPPPPPPPPGSDADDTPVDLARVELRIDELVARIDHVDVRITSISNELANQISEISNDLEARGPATPATDEVVDGLRDAQTRLANEQARYQIAFRQDLADLAARLKRA